MKSSCRFLLVCAAFLTCLSASSFIAEAFENRLLIDAPAAPVVNSVRDSSCATLVPFTPPAGYIRAVEVLNADRDRIHHVILQLCYDNFTNAAVQKFGKKATSGTYSGCEEEDGGNAYDAVSGACAHGQVIFTWAKNSPRMQLPDDTSLPIGEKFGVPYLLLQIQYFAGTTQRDDIPVTVAVHYQQNPTPKFAGVLLLGSSGAKGIPPHTAAYRLVSSCRYSSGAQPIYPFAFRVHAHRISRYVAAFADSEVTQNLGSPKVFAKGDPWLPQLFYPIPHDDIQNSTAVINPGDVIGAVCYYNASTRQHITSIGTSSASDEMCNVQIMYAYDAGGGSGSATYSASSDRRFVMRQCFDDSLKYTYKLPDDSTPSLSIAEQQNLIGSVYGSDVKVEDVLGDANMMARRHPRRKTQHINPSQISQLFDAINSFVNEKNRQKKRDLDASSRIQSRSLLAPASAINFPLSTTKNETYELVHNWFNFSQLAGGFQGLGQVAGLAYNSLNNRLYVFRRASHTWGANTFDPFTNVYLDVSKGPIAAAPILEIDIATGHLSAQWGQNMFYMPHSITVDEDENVWLTDVALHQVWKFSRQNRAQPILILGRRFEPGNDESHFCKPTDVAVLPKTLDGEFFVSDGYCNARVVKFSQNGNYIDQIGYILPSWSPSQFDFLASQRVDWSPGPTEFSIPHSLALNDDAQLLYVADRENGRVQVFRTQGAMGFVKSIQTELFAKSAVYAVDYRNETLVAVNGRLALGASIQQLVPIAGSLIATANASNGAVDVQTETFGRGVLRNPHTVAIGGSLRDIFVGEIGPNRILRFQQK